MLLLHDDEPDLGHRSAVQRPKSGQCSTEPPTLVGDGVVGQCVDLFVGALATLVYLEAVSCAGLKSDDDDGQQDVTPHTQ